MGKAIFVYIYGYLPGIKYGGPVTSIFNFTEHFGDEYDIYIVCSNHDHGEKEKYKDIKSGWNQVGKAKVCYLSEKEYSEGLFFKLMKDKSVQIVYLTGVFSYKLNHAAISAARKLNIKTVIATRGEICKNILAMKSYKKLPYLAVMKIIGEFKNCYFQVTSNEEDIQLQKYLGISKDRIVYLPNIHGKTMNVQHPQKERGVARILFISRVHPKKNLLDAIKAASKVKGNLVFDIYGPIEDAKYWNNCQKEIQKVPRNVTINYKGKLDMDGARRSYYSYHAFLFPTLSENYGHVIVESMIADCPIIISKGTTPWDDADQKAGYVVKLHDIDNLSEAIDKIIDMSSEEYEKLQNSLRNYRDEKLKLNILLSEYKKMIE